jgi:hypothetical protein
MVKYDSLSSTNTICAVLLVKSAALPKHTDTLVSENSEKLFSPIIKSIAYENTRYQKSMAYRLFQSFQ